MELKTRKPTGQPAWPFLLVEGGEKSGKSWMAAELTGSKKLSRSFWLELGNEGTVDEYSKVPGAEYDVIDHDGTWGDITQQVKAIKAYAAQSSAKGEKPICLVVDTIMEAWLMMSRHAQALASERVARKNARFNQSKSIEDADITHLEWNTVTAMYKDFMSDLRSIPGIVIGITRGREVTEFTNEGRPTSNKVYKLEGQKDLFYEVTGCIRVSRDSDPVIVGLRSVKHAVKDVSQAQKVKGLKLEDVIFDYIGLKSDTAGVMQQKNSQPVSPESIRDAILNPQNTQEDLRAEWKKASTNGVLEVCVINETGDEETLKEMITRKALEIKTKADEVSKELIPA